MFGLVVNAENIDILCPAAYNTHEEMKIWIKHF